MPSTAKETIAVKSLTKYGFQDNTGTYINWSQKLDPSQKGTVVPGGTYEFDLYIADSGKKYVNSVVASRVNSATAKAPVAVTPVAAPVKKIAPKAEHSSETMTKSEWQAKDRSQLIGGLSHDAAAITAALVTTTSLQDHASAVTLFEQILNGLIDVRDSVK